jgi:hypothetical protein
VDHEQAIWELMRFVDELARRGSSRQVTRFAAASLRTTNGTTSEMTISGD